jgi:superfamily I DNA/RNA helicase
LSTIHSAKGLEWECVFLISLTDGVLPVSFALDHEDEIEEEQRLFYVAITRARKHLFLSLHHEGTRGGITQFNKVSRFLDTPNVLSKLELRGVPQADTKETVPYEEAEKGDHVYDKKLLIQRVIDFLNKQS